MSPNEISVLLSIHICRKVDRAFIKKDTPLMVDYLKDFLRQRLIAPVSDVDDEAVIWQRQYELTDRGQIYVDYLQNIPIPREKISWVIEYVPFPPEG